MTNKIQLFKPFVTSDEENIISDFHFDYWNKITITTMAIPPAKTDRQPMVLRNISLFSQLGQKVSRSSIGVLHSRHILAI